MRPLLFSIMMMLLLAACDAPSVGDSLLSSSPKPFPNLQVKMLYPKAHTEMERNASTTFINKEEDEAFVFSVYAGFSLDKAQRLCEAGISDGNFKISMKGEFVKENDRMSSAPISVVGAGENAEGYMFLKEIPESGTYSFLACATSKTRAEELKGYLREIALSAEHSNEVGTATTGNESAAGLTAPHCQDVLMNKVLLWSNRSRSTTAVEDNTQSHGVSSYYEDVEKIRRFVLCGGGFGYFRFITNGNQMNGDTGLQELDKFSGNWKVVSENGITYLYMQDERDNRYRTWKIEALTNESLTIEGFEYKLLPTESAGNECSGKYLVVPE